VKAFTAGQQVHQPDVVEAFFAEDLVVEVTAGFTDPKTSYGRSDVNECLAFLSAFDLEGVALAFVPGVKAGEIWLTWSTRKATHKLTRRSSPDAGLIISTWEDRKCKAMKIVPADPSTLEALCSSAEGAQLPAAPALNPPFEPHPNPMAVWEKVWSGWSVGAFSRPTKHQAFEKHWAPNLCLDAASAALPNVFKVYTGHAGGDEWTNGVVGRWDTSRVSVSAVGGLKPGCVMQRLSFDCQHKDTRKAASGVEVYVLLAYDTDGKLVYGKHYFANPEVLASIY